MAKYTVTLGGTTRQKLGEVKSNFMESAFERFLYSKDLLTAESMTSGLRLLYIKEIFSIFDEINRLEDVRGIFMSDVNFDPIFDLVNFVRNTLLHFPLFNTWDNIYISADIATQLTKGNSQIAKYLDNNKENTDLTYSVVYENLTKDVDIKRSAIKPNNEITYLKDIISEKDVIVLLVDILQHIYTAKSNPV